MLSVAYGECCLCWVLLMLSVVYAECHLCWVLLMLSVAYAECRLCWVLLMLKVAYAESNLCWVSHVSLIRWVSLCWMSLYWVLLCWVSWYPEKSIWKQAWARLIFGLFLSCSNEFDGILENLIHLQSFSVLFKKFLFC